MLSSLQELSFGICIIFRLDGCACSACRSVAHINFTFDTIEAAAGPHETYIDTYIYIAVSEG